MWPLEGQPWLLRKMSELIPLRVVGMTMNDIALKGWTWNHPSIIFGVSATFLTIILLIVTLNVLGKFKKDLWVLRK